MIRPRSSTGLPFPSFISSSLNFSGARKKTQGTNPTRGLLFELSKPDRQATVNLSVSCSLPNTMAFCANRPDTIDTFMVSPSVSDPQSVRPSDRCLCETSKRERRFYKYISILKPIVCNLCVRKGVSNELTSMEGTGCPPSSEEKQKYDYLA